MTNEEIIEKLSSQIGESLGAASMCWIPRPSKQVFDTDTIKLVNNRVIGIFLAALNQARADERAKVIEQVKKLPTKPDSCYCGKPNCYGFREWVELKKVLKAIKQTK